MPDEGGVDEGEAQIEGSGWEKRESDEAKQAIWTREEDRVKAWKGGVGKESRKTAPYCKVKAG